MTAKLSTGYCLLLLEAIEWFMPLPTDFCQGDGFFYAYVHPARAQYLLGHAKAQMTLDGYTHIRGENMEGIAEIVEKSMVVKQVVK